MDSKKFWSSSERFKWTILLFIGTVMLYASRAILPIASVSIASEMQWSRKQMGLLFGTFFWGYAFTQYVGGCLSDLYGGELVIALSSMCWSLITISFVFLNNQFELFLLARFFLGIFQGFFYPSLASLMSLKLQLSERNMIYSIIHAGAHVGTLLCGSFGSYLVVHENWRHPFILLGSSSAIWSFCIYRILDRPTNLICAFSNVLTVLLKSLVALVKRKQVFLKKYVLPVSLDNSKEMDAKLMLQVTPNFDWNTLLKHKPFWVMLLANFAHNNTFYIILNWCPTYFHDNYPDARSWVFNTVPWFIIFPCVLASGFIADHLIYKSVSVTTVRKLINTIVLIGSSIFLLILSNLDNYYGSLTCMAFAVACLGFHCSGVLLNPQDMTPHFGGRLYGIMSTVGTVPGFAGVFMVGHILESTNQWPVIFNLTGAINLISWIAYSLYGSSERLF